MKIQEFLEHHGIAGNPFAEEGRPKTIPSSNEHAWNPHFIPGGIKIYGSPEDPSTSIVFGEKGAGKTALKTADGPVNLNFIMKRAEVPKEAKNLLLLSSMTTSTLSSTGLSVVLDGTDRLRNHSTTGNFGITWDAILSLAVTQLVSAIIHRSKEETCWRWKEPFLECTARS